MRHVLPLLLLAGLVAGCSTSPEGPSPSEEASRTAALRSLRGHMATVADTQATADERLNEVLEPVRRLDEALVDLEQEDTFDQRLSEHEDLHEEVVVTSVDEDLREDWFEVAEVVDEARGALAEARAVLDDEWEVDYLDAQDEVLVAVREYARVADRLTQLMIRHWPTYVEIDATIMEVAERRGNYRDRAEARDALALELDPLLGDLATAQRQLGEYRERRQEAGREVNEATADAVTVYEQRPSAQAWGRPS